MIFGQCKDGLGSVFELLKFIARNVAKLTFRKAVHKERLITLAKNHNSSVTLGLSSARTGNALLDDPATKSCIDQAPLCPFNSIPKQIS